jgi:hypothetical protein
MDGLRQTSRKYVPATVKEPGAVYERVGIHLKGSQGSFRSVDEKPALTLDFGKFRPGQKFYGLEKIHLNNSVEDPSYLNELLGSALFRSAGVPAPRVAQVLVELNGRPLGLYVLKEGFAEEFLGLYFPKANGPLYEPGLGHDADEALHLVCGNGLHGRSALKSLASAAREPDLSKRWQRLQQTLDIERFISFMAMEVMTGHRDGYCLARNNFRIYQDPETEKWVFFPHGMDQLFGKADAPVQPQMNGLVARALLETPEGRKNYRKRFELLFTNVFDLATMNEQADRMLRQVQPSLAAEEARVLREAVASAKSRIAQRHAQLEKQLGEPPMTQIQFEQGIARLFSWKMADQPVGGLMQQTTAPDGKPALSIRAGPMTSASWRTKVLLRAGHYRFEGNVRTAGVAPLGFGKSQGADLRVLGANRGEAAGLTGEQEWKALHVDFDVTSPEQEIELLCELRASAGEAWFALNSLKLELRPEIGLKK